MAGSSLEYNLKSGDNIFNNKVVQIHLIKKNGGSEVYYVHDKSSMGEFDKKYGIDYNILLPGPVPAA